MTAISDTSLVLAQRWRLAKERHVALVQVAKILEPKTEHCDPAHAETPCQDRVIDPERGRNLLAEDSGAPHLDPADAFDIHFGIEARLSVGIVGGFEPYTLEPDPVIELAEDPKQVPERDTLVHHDPFELLELGEVRGVDRLAPVDPADAECLDGRVRVPGQVLNGDARRVGAEHALLGLLFLPDPAPAGRRGLAAGDMHRL